MIGGKPRSWTDEQWQRLGAMLLGGSPASAIAEAVGKSRNTVLGAIYRAGGTATLRAVFAGAVPVEQPAPRSKKQGRTGGRGTDWTEAELATARQMRAAGRTIRAIAEALDRSLASVKGKAQGTGGFGVPAVPGKGRGRPKAIPAPAAVSIWCGWSREEKAAAVAAGLEAGRDSAAMAAAWGTTQGAVGTFRRDAEAEIAALLPAPLRGRVAPKKRHDLFLTEVRSDRPQPAEPTSAWSAPSDGGVRFLDRRPHQCARVLPRERGASILEAMVCGRPVAGETSWCAACAAVVFRPPTPAERAETKRAARAAA